MNPHSTFMGLPRDPGEHVRRHRASIEAAFAAMRWEALAIPLLLAVIIGLVAATSLGWLVSKASQEMIAPTVMVLASGTAWFVHAQARRLSTLLMGVFATAICVRELHLPGLDGAVYLTLLAVIGTVSLRRAELGVELADPWLRLFLIGAFATYVLAFAVDEHWLSFLPGYGFWHDPVEETLETCAHLQVFAATLSLARICLNRAVPSPGSVD